MVKPVGVAAKKEHEPVEPDRKMCRGKVQVKKQWVKVKMLLFYALSTLFYAFSTLFYTFSTLFYVFLHLKFLQ